MKSITMINNRLDELRCEVLALVDNQNISLTNKNISMQPLVEEKKVLEHALIFLEKIQKTNYHGLCKGN
ncbi:hypothetical protein MNB_ARC-1_1350 [hydrothermal vent metagenome]|uniref:Uncharacterized protein n=1 Tax=hydrothermal vent metagenome TaxID=652676 RepID=A0A3B1DYC2_9ZZZZ